MARSASEEEGELSSECEGFETEDDSVSDDPGKDPSFDLLEETRSSISKISLKRTRPRGGKKLDFESDGEAEEDVGEVKVPQLNAKDAKTYEEIEKMIKGGQLDKLKVDQCKVYLRKHGLRLTGNKDILLGRIREHIEVIDGESEKKYPASSFVLNCQGDACTGDVVLFQQKVYEMFSIASRSATGPPCGIRTVVGRIVKESYGAAKQQHTFTIEVLWSKGEKPLPPLYPLLIKGRNLYRIKTMRQIWEDEDERRKVLLEKHLRGSLARTSREIRIQQKETKKNNNRRHEGMNKENIPSTLNQPPSSKPSNQDIPRLLQNSQQPHAHEKDCSRISKASSYSHGGCQVKMLPLQAEECNGIRPQVVAHSSQSVKPLNVALSQQRNHVSATRQEQTACNFNVMQHPIRLSQVPATISNTSTVAKPSILGTFGQKNHVFNTNRWEAINEFSGKQTLQDTSTFRTSHFQPLYAPRFNYKGTCTEAQKVQNIQTITDQGSYFAGYDAQNWLASRQRQPIQHQLCPYHRQGRCYYMENCKFLHD